MINFDRYKGLPSSGLMFFFWSLLALLAVPLVYSNFVNLLIGKNGLFELNSSNISLLISCALVLLNVVITCIPYDVDEELNKNVCPQYRTSIISRLTHNWITR